MVEGRCDDGDVSSASKSSSMMSSAIGESSRDPKLFVPKFRFVSSIIVSYPTPITTIHLNLDYERIEPI